MIDHLNDTELYPRIKSVLQKVIYKDTSLDNLTPETRLQEDLDMDSIRVVDLVLGLEEEFGIRIEDDVIEGVKTVGALAALVRQKTASAPV